MVMFDIILSALCLLLIIYNIFVYHKSHEKFELVVIVVAVIFLGWIFYNNITHNYESELEKIKIKYTTHLEYKTDTIKCKRVITYEHKLIKLNKPERRLIPIDTTYILIKNK